MRENAMKEIFEEVEYRGKPALFTSSRIAKFSVPDGLHCYEIRHADNDWGEPCQLGNSIAVNHLGTLITNEPVQLGTDGYLDIKPEDINFGIRNDMPVSEYIQEYPPVTDKQVFEITKVNADRTDWLYSDDKMDAERGTIGHLRGDFGGSGTAFYTSWFPHNESLNKEPFKSELDNVVNWLREENGPLSNFRSMERYCQLLNSASKLTNGESSYGFRIDTKGYEYMLRFTPMHGEYNFYIYVYDKQAQLEYNRGTQKSVIDKLKCTEYKDTKVSPKKSAGMEL